MAQSPLNTPKGDGSSSNHGSSSAGAGAKAQKAPLQVSNAGEGNPQNFNPSRSPRNSNTRIGGSASSDGNQGESEKLVRDLGKVGAQAATGRYAQAVTSAARSKQVRTVIIVFVLIFAIIVSIIPAVLASPLAILGSLFSGVKELLSSDPTDADITRYFDGIANQISPLITEVSDSFYEQLTDFISGSNYDTGEGTYNSVHYDELSVKCNLNFDHGQTAYDEREYVMQMLAAFLAQQLYRVEKDEEDNPVIPDVDKDDFEDWVGHMTDEKEEVVIPLTDTASATLYMPTFEGNYYPQYQFEQIHTEEDEELDESDCVSDDFEPTALLSHIVRLGNVEISNSQMVDSATTSTEEETVEEEITKPDGSKEIVEKTVTKEITTNTTTLYLTVDIDVEFRSMDDIALEEIGLWYGSGSDVDNNGINQITQKDGTKKSFDKNDTRHAACWMADGTVVPVKKDTHGELLVPMTYDENGKPTTPYHFYRHMFAQYEAYQSYAAEFTSHLSYKLSSDEIGDGEGIVRVAEEECNRYKSNNMIGGAKYCNYLGIAPNSAWCAAFVYWCANEVGLVGETKCFGPNLGYVPAIWDYFNARGGLHTAISDPRFIPRAGDLVIFSASTDDRKSTGCHIGIVHHYDAEDDTVTTIEGNTYDDDRGISNVMAFKNYDGIWGHAWYDSSGDEVKIFAYCRPEYPTSQFSGTVYKARSYYGSTFNSPKTNHNLIYSRRDFDKTEGMTLEYGKSGIILTAYDASRKKDTEYFGYALLNVADGEMDQFLEWLKTKDVDLYNKLLDNVLVKRVSVDGEIKYVPNTEITETNGSTTCSTIQRVYLRASNAAPQYARYAKAWKQFIANWHKAATTDDLHFEQVQSSYIYQKLLATEKYLKSAGWGKLNLRKSRAITEMIYERLNCIKNPKQLAEDLIMAIRVDNKEEIQFIDQLDDYDIVNFVYDYYAENKFSEDTRFEKNVDEMPNLYDEEMGARALVWSTLTS